VRTAKLELQRLKPDSFCRTYVVAKATTHNDPAVFKQTLKPLMLTSSNVAVEEVAEKLTISVILSGAKNLYSI
jgi:hypothetical protein